MYQRETDVSAADTLDQKTASQSQRVACAVVADDFGSSISRFRRTPQRRHYAVARSRLEAAQFAGGAAPSSMFRSAIMSWVHATNRPIRCAAIGRSTPFRLRWGYALPDQPSASCGAHDAGWRVCRAELGW